MRFRELVQAIQESMSFNAGYLEKRDDGKHWVGVIDSGDRYEPDAYKSDWPANKMPKMNPKYKPELDLSLANTNMRMVMDELGYPTNLEDVDPFPIDEFIARTTQWLQKAIGKPSPEEKPHVDQNPGGPTMISGGKPEGYYNQVIKGMNHIARVGKQNGATHVWAI
tara:strand:- start:193 stop:690 length:498 start_codon:yes stop_codon:yes gene_type:complete